MSKAACGNEAVRVLIAEDGRRARNGLCALLSTWPEVRVVGEAGDGKEAVRLVAERVPHVVLMDARMPALDGIEATRIIKGRWPGVRVVIVTILASYRAEARAAGADAFLLKGCAAEDLRAAIDGALNDENAMASVQTAATRRAPARTD